MLKIGWFSTGRDEAARQLLQVVQKSIRRRELDGEIIFVFSNREGGEAKESDLFFELVRNYNIPLVCLSYNKFRNLKVAATTNESDQLPSWRLDYDREIMRRLSTFFPDLCVLAGYMLIVGKEMCQKYKMINLHPAPPGGPTGTWQEVIWKLIETRAQKSGVMIHLVTPELDRGPVMTFCTYSIRGEPFDAYWKEIDRYSLDEIKGKQGENNTLFWLIRQFGLKREFPMIVATLKAFSQNKIKIADGKVIDEKGQQIAGYDLTEEIDKLVEEGKVGTNLL